ncbi:MAG: adenylate/guanylate cyclase domain-containing protein [Aestuariivita sp.]|uniref:adenylate/guanylate cyclase domain-containing protein n=1 Tax=Aestuariivita sp. TaxID=1872407 RepID=UPI003BB15C86
MAAILAADIVGYSRLIGLDEEGTRARLNAVLSDVVKPALARCRGRLFKTTGDGFFAEFASVVDAVDCAVEIQTAMNRETAGATAPLRFRMGVNLGDILVEGDIEFARPSRGQCDGANVEFERAIDMEPSYVRLLSRSALSLTSKSFIQISDPDAMARFEAGLRSAGLPD